MIYEITLLNPPAVGPDLFSLRPSELTGWIILLLSLFVLPVYLVLGCKGKITQQLDRFLSLLIPSGIFAGLFTASFGTIDEVSINLEHAYNLFNHGLFSMSRDEVIDGTVEVVFYLLHWPFAASPRTLILGNFALCFVVGWLHLFLVWRWLNNFNGGASFWTVVCVAAYAPVVTAFATGFGNGLLSLVYLQAVLLVCESKYRQSLLVSGLLPLIRPDGILLAAVNGIVVTGMLIHERLAFGKRAKWGGIFMLLSLPVVSAFLYATAYGAYFRVWPPTPIVFKSLELSQLVGLLHPRGMLSQLVEWASRPEYTLPLVVVLVVTMFVPVFNRWPACQRRIVVIYCQILVSVPIFAFYLATTRITAETAGYTVTRYWLGFLFLLILFVSLLAAATPGIATNFSSRLYRPLSAVLLIFMLLIGQKLISVINSIPSIDRRDGSFAGALLDKVLPEGMTVATSEMNTFGLMIDRPVIDLWGYSTRAIAESKQMNASAVRNNPNFFLEAQPDVFWPYWLTQRCSLTDGKPLFGTGPAEQHTRQIAEDYDLFPNHGIETSLATFHHTSRELNLLGDMRNVMKDYNVVVVVTDVGRIGLLVRKPKTQDLLSHLATRFGAQISRQRQFDMENFKALYK